MKQQPVEVTRVMPKGSRITRVTVEGACCGKCSRPLRVGDRAMIDRGKLVHPKDMPCVPAWQG